MRLSIDVLQTFLAVVESGGFTRAGRVTNRTQSAVSQQMRKLEETLEQRLFHRDGKGMRLTTHGEALLPYARRIVRAHDDACAAMTPPGPAGVVRLGAQEDYAARLLPEVLARFATVCPHVQVTMRCENSTRLLRALARGELDLVISTADLATGGEEGAASIQGRVLGREPLVWVTASQGFVHEADPVPLALFPRGCHYRRWALDALDLTGRRYRVAYESPSTAGLQAVVTAGLAVTPMGLASAPAGARFLGEEDGFPPMPAATLTLYRSSGPQNEAVGLLAARVVEAIREPRDHRKTTATIA